MLYWEKKVTTKIYLKKLVVSLEVRGETARWMCSWWSEGRSVRSSPTPRKTLPFWSSRRWSREFWNFRRRSKGKITLLGDNNRSLPGCLSFCLSLFLCYFLLFLSLISHFPFKLPPGGFQYYSGFSVCLHSIWISWTRIQLQKNLSCGAFWKKSKIDRFFSYFEVRIFRVVKRSFCIAFLNSW